METHTEKQKLHWDIHPSIVLQLGEDLITDVVQALVELVKNSYDADATYAKVVISTAENNYAPESLYQEAKGSIVIDDDGIGMDLPTIQRGWLTISNSLKREMKSSKQYTKRNRTPLGDKGLGRLGAQRLGHNLEIITKPEGSTIGYHVGCCWRDFKMEELLSKVPVVQEFIPNLSRKGTRVIISDLKDSEQWKGDAVVRLQNQLSQMISPYSDVRDFRVFIYADGKHLELADISDKVRDSAQLRYRITYRNQKLYISGKARLAFLRPNDRSENERFRRLIEQDGGNGFLHFLTQQPAARDLAVTHSNEDGWFVEFENSCNLTDLDSVLLVDGTPADPGPFTGEVDSFDLGESSRTQSVFDKASEYRDYIKNLSGIRVYRDGFAVRVDRDWLKLGEAWTSATSYYGLKPSNTIGYIALSARDNYVLEETTDREGFKATPYYQNFFQLLQHFVWVTQQAQELLRRTALDYVRTEEKNEAGVTQTVAPEEIIREINNGLSRAKELEKPLQALSVTLSDTVALAQNSLNTTKTPVTNNDRVTETFQSAAVFLTARINEAKIVIGKVQQYIRETEQLEKLSNVLSDQIDQLHDQLDMMYETVSLGLTAEALSHEIHNAADRLAQLTRQITEHIRKSEQCDLKIVSFVEHVNSSISAMRKQLSHLAPSLRYVREERENMDISTFFNEITGYYKEHLKQRNIRLETQVDNSFQLCMNRGKLTQIIDNLVLNSEYWLREDLRTGRISQGIIRINICKPHIQISDNARGIDTSVEESLFQPFITTKGRGKGRGLGLFIVKQLLDSEGCNISLLPIRNEQGRRYIFEIDFSGGLGNVKQQ